MPSFPSIHPAGLQVPAQGLSLTYGHPTPKLDIARVQALAQFLHCSGLADGSVQFLARLRFQVQGSEDQLVSIAVHERVRTSQQAVSGQNWQDVIAVGGAWRPVRKSRS